MSPADERPFTDFGPLSEQLGGLPPSFPEAIHLILPRYLPHWGMLLVCFLFASAPCRAASDFRIQPEQILLQGNYSQAQLLVTEANCNERSADLTHQASYTSSNSDVVRVSATGRLLAVGNGQATITALVQGISRTVPVQVREVLPNPPISFVDQVLPVISKAGCNAAACHASQYGKGGFKLSVFAYAPDEDYYAVVRYGFGRRVNRNDPPRSLVLMKPTLGVPHEGGHRLQAGSTDYQILLQWLTSGTPGPDSKSAPVTSIQVFPKRRVGPERFTQQLRVLATYSNGFTRDVTAWTKFDSMDEGVLGVSSDGLVRAVGRGQGVAMARFGGQADVANFVVPYAESAHLKDWTDNNWIDTLAAAKFKEIGITPSPLCDDATFLRRAYLDATGTLPTVAQATAFLDSKDPAKRKQLIDELLGLTGDPARDIHGNDYAAYWTLKWSDLIRSNSVAIGEQGMWALYNWMKQSFRENKPWNQFVRELLTAKGSTYCNGPANYFRIATSPQDRAEETSQLFLGVRLQCAKCHHHPYETFSQDDYYGFAAFFARISNKTSQEFGLFGGENVILVSSAGEVRNPRTGKVLPPTPLGGSPLSVSIDRREALAGWLTSSENVYFARNIVNRYMAYLLGRGLVEPIDDLRATNAPSNAALLDRLAADFVHSGFDLKHLLRTIMNSRLYQLDSEPTKGNLADDRFYSHYRVKRPPAEALLDAIDDATGVRTKFPKVPLGTRAIELPDAQYNNYFLAAFGKPRREAVCECERVSEPNLSQALHTLNSDVLSAKIANTNGRIGKQLAAKKSPNEIIDELYLATLCRRPHAEERSACEKMLASNADKKTIYEDLLWSLINTKYFLFVH